MPAPSVDIDISKLDIRVGEIVKAWEHEEADTLYCEEIDLGEASGPRQITSGLKAHYTLEELIGRKVLVVAYLKSKISRVSLPRDGLVCLPLRRRGGGWRPRPRPQPRYSRICGPASRGKHW